MSALAGTTRAGQLSALLPRSVARTFVPKTAGGRPESLARWAAAEMGRHDWRLLLEAGVAIGRYDARSWIGEVDVPTAVVVTTRDRTVGVLSQLELARSVPGATLHRLEDGHVACANASFGPPLSAACREVGARAADRRRLRAV
jgi:pimeloyl-ACP methyl ester carboxylesterase